MTWEEAGLKSDVPAVRAGLTYLASLNVSAEKLQKIKDILEGHVKEEHRQHGTNNTEQSSCNL